MSIDHKRPLPIAPERLEHMVTLVYGRDDFPFDRCTPAQKLELYKLALAGEQVEQTQQVAFLLAEAYDIYNARFR